MEGRFFRMFWIPFMFIVCIISFIVYLMGTTKGTKNANEYKRYEESQQRLFQYASDSALENELSSQLDLKLGEWKETVQQFMGGSPEWADYVDYTKGKLKAMMVIMARRGKLPASCINFGVNLPVSNILPERAFLMNEEFILRIERELNLRTSLTVTAYVWTTLKGSSKTIHMTLRDFISQYGSGKTHFSTTFQFVGV